MGNKYPVATLWTTQLSGQVSYIRTGPAAAIDNEQSVATLWTTQLSGQVSYIRTGTAARDSE